MWAVLGCCRWTTAPLFGRLWSVRASVGPTSVAGQRYLIRSDLIRGVSGVLIERVRHAAGLTQEDLAERVGTSRTALSAYEHGRKSPTLATAERIVAGAGFALSVEPVVSFREATTRRGRPFFVADRLWRLPVAQALATVTLPLELNWSVPGSTWSLAEPPAGTLLRSRARGRPPC